jgi:hypothetical protein
LLTNCIRKEVCYVKEVNLLKAGDEVCLFKKDGLIPVTCGVLKYFDEKHDKVCINVNERPVKLTKHLYDFVSTSVSTNLEPKDSFMQARLQYMQFSGMVKSESKT